MAEFTFSIAGIPIAVRNRFGSTQEYFKKYITDLPPLHTVEAVPEELVSEQQLLNEEADQLGLRRRVFTEPFLERAALQRKVAGIALADNTILLHGSTIAVDGRAYLFTANCGVGKSTHTRLWRQMLGARAEIVNDDRAFLHISNDGILAYGSPWSGKHGLDSNLCVPLAGICILERGQENRIHPVSAADALPFLIAQAFLPAPEDVKQVSALTRTIAVSIPLWQMYCTKEPEAAEMAYSAMSRAERVDSLSGTVYNGQS